MMNNKLYIPFLPLFNELDKMQMDRLQIIAIEGGSASGKTTLGETLKKHYDCTVFHTDDFFLQPEQRTPARLSEVGGNIDRERFLEEILIPLKKGKPVCYRKFDCSKMALSSPINIKPKSLVIIEGAYSMHPEFERFYDFSVFLDISPRLQKERIKKRNSPDIANRFLSEWIPLENTYFQETQIKNRCNMSILITE